jgi:hypothetical protein
VNLNFSENNMSLYEHENDDYARPNLIEGLKKEKIIDATVENVSILYQQFLTGKDPYKVLFATDFVEGRDPLRIPVASSDVFEIEYEAIQAKLSSLFSVNRRTEFGIGSKTVESKRIKDLKLVTQGLIDFREQFPNEIVTVEKTFELLMGESSPTHGLSIERYIDPLKFLAKSPLGEVWYVKRFDEGFSSSKSIEVYHNVQRAVSVPVNTVVRRVDR